MSEGAQKKQEKPRKFQAIRGTRDILPPETALWNRVEQTAHEVFATFGFGEIRLPLFEETELFRRSVGAETDVGKEMWYTFQDPLDLEQIIKERQEAGPNPYEDKYGDLRAVLFEVQQRVQALTLRPEATASVCRAYVQNGMQQQPQPVRLYYMGPMFRRERPQKGRYRQFYQIGAEVLGGPGAPSVDAEVIEMVMSFFRKVGLLDAKLEINSIGDQNCRPAYVRTLRDALFQRKASFGMDSQRRIETNPLRVLDSKSPAEQEAIESLPRITDHLCEDCLRNYEEVKQQLRLRNVPFKENWRLVRGLDYYVRTTFEVTGSGLGSQDAICGGGRYDGLVEMLGGPKNTKGIGFAIGEDRLIQSLEQGRIESSLGSSMDVMVVGTSASTWDEATRLGSSLRRQGLRVYLPNAGTPMSKAMDTANRERIRVAVIVGDNELSANKYAIRILRPFIEQGAKDSLVDTDKVELYGRLVKLRNDLERKLLGLLGESPTLFKGRALTGLVQELRTKNLIPTQHVEQLLNLIPILNRSIHGDSLTEASPEWALVVGNTILIELDRLSQPLKE